MIQRARADDAAAILQLLAESGLPADGLLDHLNTAIVARTDGRVVGCAALEVYLGGALLRSVAVAAAARGHGIGASSQTLRWNWRARLVCPPCTC